MGLESGTNRQENLESVAKLGGVGVETVKDLGKEQEKSETTESGDKTEAEPSVGDKISLVIEGVLVEGVKIKSLDEKNETVTVQIPEALEELQMPLDVFQMGAKQAKRRAEVEKAVKGKNESEA